MGSPTFTTPIRCGLHAASDWTTAPGTLKYLSPEPGWSKTTRHARIERPYEGGDGERFHAEQGVMEAALSSLAIPVKGINGGAGDSTSTSAATKMDALEMMLTSLCGTGPTDYEGETSHAVGAGTGTSLILAAAPENLAAGGAALVMGAGGKRQARFFTGLSSDTLTMCRSLTTDLGASENAAIGEVVNAGAVWHLDGETNNHRHLFFDHEDGQSFFQMLGCIGDAQLRADSGGNLHLVYGSLTGTSFTESSTLPGLAYTAPTAGNHVKVINSPVWIGSTLYMAHSIGFSFGLQLSPRASDGAPAGHYGQIVNKPFQATLEMTLHYGTLTAPAEVNRAKRLAFDANDNREDVLVQFGRDAGAAMAIRIPQADLSFEDVRENGQQLLRVTAQASRSTEAGGVQIAVF